MATRGVDPLLVEPVVRAGFVFGYLVFLRLHGICAGG